MSIVTHPKKKAKIEVVEATEDIIEPHVCALIEDIFRTRFSIPCMYDACENIITLAEFYVIRDDDMLYACCNICFDVKSGSGKPGKPVIATEHRRLALWR